MGPASESISHPAFHNGQACPYEVAARFVEGRTGAVDPRDEVAEWRVDIDAALTPKGKAPLSLNDRMHYMAHANAVARIKAVVRNAVIVAEIPHLSHVHVEMHFRPKTNRFRDIDNLVATMKPAIDALHQHDTAVNHPVPYEPIIDGDDPRYLTASWPILHAWQRAEPPALWLILRSAG
jgi:crossover junction endodeoxyribonuclease RusA